MTTPDEAAYRTHTQPGGDAIELRQPENTDDVFDVRLPVATTGEVRNEGDEPLTRDELDGMRAQLAEGGVPVFLDHGGTHYGGARYGATEKIGEWVDPDIRTRDEDGEDELVATARLMDPISLPEAVGPIRQALAVIRGQVERGMSVSSSIGWRVDDAYPGGVDLMEVSIVGIGADPRTTSQSDAAMVARAAVEAGADAEALVAEVRNATGVADDEHDMTDEPDPDEGTDTDEEQDADDGETETLDADDYREQMLAMQEQQTQLLETLASDYDDKDGDDDEDDDDGEQSADEPDEAQSADTDDTDDAADTEMAERVADLESELADLRDGGVSADDVETPTPDEEQDADDASGDTDDDKTERGGDSGPAFGFGPTNTED